MKFGIISDIHGNLTALEAVLSVIDAERVDRLVCLGDVAATGPQPAESLARLAATGCPVVMGNTDADLLDPDAMDTGEGEDARRITEIDRWCSAQLGKAERALLRSFAPTVEVDLGGGVRMLCVHGGLSSFSDIVIATTPEAEVDRMLDGNASTVVAGGHTHVAMVRMHRGVTLLNPGSVGLAYETLAHGGTRVPPWAEFGLLTVDGEGSRAIELRRVPYDRAATVRAMHERGMPHVGWWSEDWK